MMIDGFRWLRHEERGGVSGWVDDLVEASASQYDKFWSMMEMATSKSSGESSNGRVTIASVGEF